MVDKRARSSLAEGLRHLVAGVITNDQFEDRGANSQDPAIFEVEWLAAWPLYDDNKEHYVRDVPADWKMKAARAILFLHSDLEYEWPGTTGLGAIGWFLLGVLTFGWATRGRREQRRNGDQEVWPFYRAEDYEAALARPPYLARRAV